MKILDISKIDENVTLELSGAELVKLCNVLYAVEEENDDDLYHNLYADLIVARDLCQYGHLDNFSLSQIVKSRNSCEKGLDGVLPDDQADLFADYLRFTKYLKQGDPNAEFLQTQEFWNLYAKVVGKTRSKEMERELS